MPEILRPDMRVSVAGLGVIELLGPLAGDATAPPFAVHFNKRALDALRVAALAAKARLSCALSLFETGSCLPISYDRRPEKLS